MWKQPWSMALVQAEPVAGDVAAGVQAVTRHLNALRERSPAAAPVRLAVFPELFLGGYDLARTAEVAVRLDEPPLAGIARAARDSGIALVCGFAERAADGRLLNSAAAIDAGGRLQAVYRKTHLFAAEHRVFAAGDEPVVVDLDGVRLGLGICFDLELPEYSRLLALRGAQVLCFPTANMVPWAHYQRVYAPARAMENQCFVAVCNRVGTEGGFEFFGESGVWGPEGSRLAAAPQGAEACVLASMDPGLAERVADYPFHYLDERRPGLYGPLAQGGAGADGRSHQCERPLEPANHE